jgi:hypothetical protein
MTVEGEYTPPPAEKSVERTYEFINSSEHNEWVKTRWRPAIAWQYFAVCLFDFIIAPVLTMFFYFYTSGVYVPWAPITFAGGGLYHLSMGAIVGVSAWSRGQEKIKGVES